MAIGKRDADSIARRRAVGMTRGNVFIATIPRKFFYAFVKKVYMTARKEKVHGLLAQFSCEILSILVRAAVRLLSRNTTEMPHEMAQLKFLWNYEMSRNTFEQNEYEARR